MAANLFGSDSRVVAGVANAGYARIILNDNVYYADGVSVRAQKQVVRTFLPGNKILQEVKLVEGNITIREIRGRDVDIFEFLSGEQLVLSFDYENDHNFATSPSFASMIDSSSSWLFQHCDVTSGTVTNDVLNPPAALQVVISFYRMKPN